MESSGGEGIDRANIESIRFLKVYVDCKYWYMNQYLKGFI